jgi:hypothetical protein
MKDDTALVSGFARSFISGYPIPYATITALENQQVLIRTDAEGRFGPFQWPVGKPITLVFEKTGSFWSGYKTTQTATLIVPNEGFNNPNVLKNISFQVPSNMAFKFLSLAMGKTEDPKACQIAATITPPNTTMDDIPQGVGKVQVTLSPKASSPSTVKTPPFYFGMFPLVHKTNPFVRTLESTSLDGGVAFLNVPPGEYVMEATRDTIPFSKVSIRAREGMIVNACPPHGPTMLRDMKPEEMERQTNPFNFFKPLAIGITAGVCLSGLALSRSFK